MAEKALTAVIQEAYIQGVSTRSVDDLVQEGFPPQPAAVGTLDGRHRISSAAWDDAYIEAILRQAV